MKTFQATTEGTQRDWFVVDAQGRVLGRLASEIASRLRGKHKPIYTPHQDTGDFIVVVNAEKILLTGKKLADKVYYHHSGYPGGIKQKVAGKILQDNPTFLIKEAVKGMLPKNSLGRRMLKKVKVYAGGVHPHDAQCPKPLSV